MPTPWQAPADYQLQTSAVPGITVYAPRPAAPAAPERTTVYECPQCGAATRFDVTAGGVACEHCGYQAAVRAQVVGARAERFEFTLETLSQAERGWGVTRRLLHCEQCGAELALPEDALTATCPFCASNHVDVRSAPADVMRPRFILPFQVKPDGTAGLARVWLGRGWYHPGELAAQAAVQGFTGVYLPYWTFDAVIGSQWRAEVGYERSESYYDSQDKEWKSRTVIDWRWESGDRRDALSNWLLPGTTRVSKRLLERLGAFDLAPLSAYSPDFLAGWQALAYDVPLTAAWEAGKAAMREHAREACRGDIGSSHVRNFSLQADFGDEAWRFILLPVYVAAYTYLGKSYQVLIHGQSGKVEGQKPVAWWKVWAVIALMLSPGVCLGAIGLPLLFAGGAGMIPLVLGFAALIGGGIFGLMLYQQAAASEAA